jgi:hypothetical protein
MATSVVRHWFLRYEEQATRLPLQKNGNVGPPHERDDRTTSLREHLFCGGKSLPAAARVGCRRVMLLTRVARTRQARPSRQLLGWQAERLPYNCNL